MTTRRTNAGDYVKLQKAIDPEDSAAATITGAAIDRTGFNSCVLHAAAGAASGTPSAQTVDAKIQDSATSGGSFVDFAGGAITTITADDSDAEVDVDLSGAKAFVKVVVTVGFTGGTTPAIPVASTLALGGSEVEPV